MKDIILKKSLELFTKHGFKMVTMDEIAKDLGISKKTIYTHYKSKDDLVEDTVNYILNEATERLYSIAGTCETPIHEHFAIKNCIGDLFGHKIQTSTIYQFNKYYPKIAEKINLKRHKDYDFTILRNLREGVRLGYYRSDIDIEFVGRMFFLTSTSFINDDFYFINSNDEYVEELNYKILEYHLRSIVSSKGLEILEQLLKNPNIE